MPYLIYQNKHVLNKVIYYICRDESRITAHQYMVIGEIYFNKNNYLTIDNTINKFSEEGNMKTD